MINKDLKQKFNQLKNISPNSEWQALNRDFLVKQIKSNTTAETIGIFDYIKMFSKDFAQKAFQPAVVMLLMLGVFLSSSLVINAAFYSLPGDNLYKVKIALENTQLAVTPSEERKVELKIEFVKKRVAELDKITSDSTQDDATKKEKINTVVKELNKNVISFKEHVDKKVDNSIVDDVQKKKTLMMAVSISTETDDLLKTLLEETNDLSDEQKVEVLNLIKETVTSAEEASMLAQEIIDDASKSNEVDEIDLQAGEVKGESIEIEAKEEIISDDSETQSPQNTEMDSQEMQETSTKEVPVETEIDSGEES